MAARVAFVDSGAASLQREGAGLACALSRQPGLPARHQLYETRLLTMQSNPAGIAPPVVVVDDDQDAREMLSEYLAYCGFAVHQARDGREAIDVAERVRPALMLMDLMMPRMDGWEATRRLKTSAATCDITIVAVSACTHSGDQERARRVGCDEFVCKPVDLESLAQLVNRLLARSPLGGAEIV